METNRSNAEKKETMTDLIDCIALLPCQVSALIDRIFFEEVANFVARSQEVFITDLVVVIGREFCLTVMNLRHKQNYVTM